MSRKYIFVYPIFIILILAEVLFCADDKYFGEIIIQFDSTLEQTYNIERALLFRNVSIVNDSTATIQNEEGVDVFFYPQLNEGHQNVLRLIARENSDSTSKFYDIFINLGDSIPDNLNLQNENGLIYILPNGEALSNVSVSQNINGEIKINQDTKSEAVSGRIDLNLDYSSYNDINVYQQIHLAGNFNVPVGVYEETSLATEADRKSRESKYKRNIYAGLIISIFLIAIFGLK
jgi:hypothetical protein